MVRTGHLRLVWTRSTERVPATRGDVGADVAAARADRPGAVPPLALARVEC